MGEPDTTRYGVCQLPHCNALWSMGREGIEPSRCCHQRILSHRDLNPELPQHVVGIAPKSYYRQYAVSLFCFLNPSSLLELEEPPFHRKVLTSWSPHLRAAFDSPSSGQHSPHKLAGFEGQVKSGVRSDTPRWRATDRRGFPQRGVVGPSSLIGQRS
jgi:hypothetical protein